VTFIARLRLEIVDGFKDQWILRLLVMRIIGLYVEMRFKNEMTKPLKIHRFLNSVALFILSTMEIICICDLSIVAANLVVLIATARYTFELMILIFPVPFYLILTSLHLSSEN
jgi:hypothetical protein